ncbi:UNVERIFIED_CONTAM: hypothetical protein GTU68_004659 [Idotea baltica]|nr:hypothetical protein [Idotea baltica]
MTQFDNIYGGARVLITGHTGFKGSWLTAWLSQLGADIHGYSLGLLDSPSHFETGGFGDFVASTFADIRDFDAISKVVSDFQPDFVFHLAAQAIVAESYISPLETLQTNTIGTANLLEALRSSNHDCSAVIVTSDKCYENQEWAWGYRETDRLGGADPYSASKAAAELMVATFHQSFFSKADSNVKIASGRAGNVIGGGDWAANRIIPDAVRAITRHENISIRSPRSTRPWQHALEPLSGYLRIGQCIKCTPETIAGEAYNFGPSADEDHDVESLLLELLKHWPQDYDPVQISTISNFKEQGLLKLSCDKAKSVLGWSPTLGFSEGVRFTANWYQQFEEGKAVSDITKSQINKYLEAANGNCASWIEG